MINSSSPINPTYDISATNIQSKSSSSTSDIISSFKEIFALMTATSNMSPGQQTGMGIGDLMAPLMLLLLERLVEQQIEQDPSAESSTTLQSSTNNSVTSLFTAIDQGSKPAPSGRPVTGRLTQEFHRGHNGLDIAVPVGTPIQTTMDGQIVHAGWNNQGYGNLVIVEYGEYRTYYAHLSSIPVSVGETVKAGATIGLSGNTGNSTGPHLHYEIRRNKVPIDPTAATFGAG
jgi:murein DD-endopeptidase MepM/ murein hydrolase activator NlpD